MTVPGDDGFREEAITALHPDQSCSGGWQAWRARLQFVHAYLPTGTHESDTDRDGLLSYSVEVHAAILGLVVGITAGSTGNTQRLLALVSIALGVGRVQQSFSETVRGQLITEPWYGVTFAALGYSSVLLLRYFSTGGLR